MTRSRPHSLIVGCGYVGERLARRLADVYDITAIVRSAERAAALNAAGIVTVALDLDRVRLGAWIPEKLEQAAIFYLAPPPATGESDLRLDRFLQLATVPPRAFVYMSTTGVYGDTEGAPVDEGSPVQPLTDRARRRVSAEEMTRVWCTERRVRRVVLRVPGIYGPGRLPLERLRRREPRCIPTMPASATGFMSMIWWRPALPPHSMPKRAVSTTSLMATPAARTDFLDRVAALTGLPPAPRVSMDEAQLTFSPERLSFLHESRRVINERMLKHLGVKPRYADMDEGIRRSLEEESRMRGGEPDGE